MTRHGSLNRWGSTTARREATLTIGTVVLALAATVGVEAAELRVPTPEFATIQRALDFAADGDTVLVEPGGYVISEPLDFNRLHVPGDPDSPPRKDIVLRSVGGPEVTSIRMSFDPTDRRQGHVFHFAHGESAASVVEGFHVIGAQGSTIGVRGAGFILVGSSPTIRDCTIERHVGRGGILCHGGSSPLVERCTIRDNTADEGGGVTSSERSAPTFVNCIITNNFSDTGGGVFVNAASLSMVNCTIRRNFADHAESSGLFVVNGGRADVLNSIIWSNRISITTDSTLVIDSSATQTTAPLRGEGNLNRDPRFRSESDSRLRLGSPCIDSATSNGAPDVDIDGVPRPAGPAHDMGAHESVECVTRARFRRGDTDGDGEITITDAVVTLAFLFLGGAVPPCLDAADADDSGGIELSDGVVPLNFLFLGGPTPPAPGPRSCGPDATDDSLDCRQSPCPTEPTTPLAFTTIARSSTSGAPAQEVILRTPEALDAFWSLHASIFFPPPEPPEIDFDEEMVVGVVQAHTSGGHHVEIEAVLDRGDAIKVLLTHVGPSIDCPTTDAETQPHHLVRVPRRDGDLVTIVEQRLACCSASMDARGVGPCEAFFGYAWTGTDCVGLSGCSCEGEDCRRLFPTLQDCRDAFRGCSVFPR